MMKLINVEKYKTLVFDCDGVILNSNALKSKAFFAAAKNYGKVYADELVNYHISNGGISRYEKFRYFFENILCTSIDKKKYDDALKDFSNFLKNGLLNCEICEGLDELKKLTRNSNWLIVSGGDQNEIREIFTKRSIAHYFDGGIYGSPDDKKFILKREVLANNIKNNALFIGDSKYDYIASKEHGLDFIFLSGWTEVVNWEKWVRNLRLPTTSCIKDLCKL